MNTMMMQKFNWVHYTIIILISGLSFIFGMMIEASLTGYKVARSRDYDIYEHLINLHVSINELDDISRQKTINTKQLQNLVYSLRDTDTQLSGSIYGITGYPRKSD